MVVEDFHDPLSDKNTVKLLKYGIKQVLFPLKIVCKVQITYGNADLSCCFFFSKTNFTF